jgi:hypothetical protein
MPKFYTYRFSNLPKHINLSNLLDARLIRRSSLAPCPEAPDTFNVATVTFEGEPSFAGQLQNGLADLPIAESEGTVRVDADFYGITPLNSVSGSNVRAEYVSPEACDLGQNAAPDLGNGWPDRILMVAQYHCHHRSRWPSLRVLAE